MNAERSTRAAGALSLLVVLVLLSGGGCSDGPSGPGNGQDLDSVCAVQSYDETGASLLNGERVTVRGIVTVPRGCLVYLYIEEASCGVAVSFPDTLASSIGLGDSVRVSGRVGEATDPDEPCGFVTQISCADGSDFSLLSTGNPEPQAAALDILDIATEENEGRLVRARAVVIQSDFDVRMTLQDATGVIDVYRCLSDSLDFSAYSVGETLSVTGVVTQCDSDTPYLDGYRLRPRFQRDVQD